MKRLYKSKTDIKIAGVCAGLAKYAGIDPNIVRVLTVLALLATGVFPVGIGYILAAWLLPVEPPYNVVDEQ